MRPADDLHEQLYECFGCTYRAGDPDARTCPECGERLHNIGAPRDL